MLKKFLKNAKLSLKFNLFLILAFLIGVLVSGAALSRVLDQKAQDEVATKALVLIETMTSVRDYTNTHVNPLLNPRLETEKTFIPETVPAFSATEIFENLRKNETYKKFFYKEAALNPTNLRDKADHFETDIVEGFRQKPEIKELSGFRDLPTGKVFYIARPLAVTEQRCLRCHSTPDKAPKSQLATYGLENGFGWKLNEVVAAQIITVPAEEIFNSAQRVFSLIMGILIAIFALVIFIINFLLKRAVIQRIIRIAKVAQQVSKGEMSADFEQSSNDEIGSLTIAFNRMKSSLEIAMKLLNQQQKD
jgi:HAMP domain-containing protein